MKLVELLRTQKKNRMLEQRRAVQLLAYWPRTPTLCNSHGSSVFLFHSLADLSLNVAHQRPRRLFPASVSGRRWEWIQQRQFLFHICRGSTFNVLASLVAVIPALVLPSLHQQQPVGHEFRIPCLATPWRIGRYMRQDG